MDEWVDRGAIVKLPYHFEFNFVDVTLLDPGLVTSSD